MPDINYMRDYGMPPACPFWMIFREGGKGPTVQHETLDAAETESRRLATENPGARFHILAVVATVSTSSEVIGQRFDPNRIKLIERPAQPGTVVEEAPEFAEVGEPLEHVAADEPL